MDLAAFKRDLAGLPLTDDPALVRRKSRDFYWYSPILKAELDDKVADLVAEPRDEDQVLRILAACVRHRVPVTPRGGGTGNYGQAMPLAGGLILDLSGLNRIRALTDGILDVETGAKMGAIEQQTRPEGWELRMYPSTKRTATIGGFLCGGSGGIGSITYGGLRERGNVLAARIATAEPEPRVLELAGDDCNLINRTYGTTGILLSLKIPLARTFPWRDVVLSFDDFADTMRCGQALALTDGVDKKLVSAIDWPLPSHFRPLRDHLEPSKSILIAMVAPAGMAALRTLAAQHRGRLVYDVDAVAAEADPAQTPLYEYTWNHTTLHVLKQDRSVTYLQSLFPVGRNVEATLDMRRRYGDELMMHAEFIRFDGQVTNSALQVVRYTTPERLNRIIDEHEEAGVRIANPHVYTLEDGSRHKRLPGDQLSFKRQVDPFGVLNPGKMRSFVPA